MCDMTYYMCVMTHYMSDMTRYIFDMTSYMCAMTHDTRDMTHQGQAFADSTLHPYVKHDSLHGEALIRCVTRLVTRVT